MNKKLFVGGLNFRTSEDVLREIFETVGTVEDVKIIIDRETGRSKGFGFVSFADAQDAEDAEDALAKFDGQELDGRQVKVSMAIENNRRGGQVGPQRGFGHREEKESKY